MHDTLSLPHPRIQADAVQRRSRSSIRCADCGLPVRARAWWKQFCAACLADHHNQRYFERYCRDPDWRESIKAAKRAEWRNDQRKKERQYRQRRLRSARRRQALRGVS